MNMVTASARNALSLISFFHIVAWDKTYESNLIRHCAKLSFEKISIVESIYALRGQERSGNRETQYSGNALKGCLFPFLH